MQSVSQINAMVFEWGKVEQINDLIDKIGGQNYMLLNVGMFIGLIFTFELSFFGILVIGFQK